jgi:hypothetical protein
MVALVGEITIITIILTLIFVVPHALEHNVLPEPVEIGANAPEEDNSTSSEETVLPRFELLKMSESRRRRPPKS